MKKRFLIVALVMAFVVVFAAAVMAEQTIRIGDVHFIDGVALNGGGQCATFTASPGSIPDNNPAGICSTLAVSGLGNTTLVTMTVATTHTWVGDLTYWLTSPGGSTLYFMSRPGIAGPAGPCCGEDANLASAFPLDFYDAAAVDAEQVGFGLTTSQVACQNDGVCDFNPGPDGQTGLTDFAGFNGQDSTGNWQFCASDQAGLDTGSVASVNLNICAAAPPAPAIAVTKTVGLDATACATTSNIQAPYNSFVTYCYTVANTGNVTLTHHTVVDDKLGTLWSNNPLDLGPGDSAFFTVTTQITDSVTNVVAWTATVTGTAISATGGGTATVTGQPTDVTLTTFGSNETSWLIPTISVMVLVGLGALYFARRRQEA